MSATLDAVNKSMAGSGYQIGHGYVVLNEEGELIGHEFHPRMGDALIEIAERQRRTSNIIDKCRDEDGVSCSGTY